MRNAIAITFVVLILAVPARAYASDGQGSLVRLVKSERLTGSKEINRSSAAPIEVQQPYDFKLTGIEGMLGTHYTIAAKAYTRLTSIDYAGHSYLLVPAVDSLLGGERSGGSIVSGCGSTVKPHVAINPENGAVLEKSVRRITSCDGRRAWWEFGPGLKQVTMGRIYLPTQAESIQQAEFAAGRQAMEAELQLRAKVAENNATRGKKSEIGAQLCKTESGVIYTGFTEAVSPDNGRLKIQIVQARLVGARNLSPGGFQPTMTWASPDDWDLCE